MATIQYIEVSSTPNEVTDKINEIIDVATSTEPTWGMIGGNITDQTDLVTYVNDAVVSISGTFRGTFHTIEEFPTTGNKKNDYCHHEVIDPDSGLVLRYDVYRWSKVEDQTALQWNLAYTLNNSTFTAVQLAAINSGITAAKVTEYEGYSTSKADAINVYTKSQTYSKTEFDNLVAGKAPSNHAYPTDAYGAGTAEKYGHVKVFDEVDLYDLGLPDSATVSLKYISNHIKDLEFHLKDGTIINKPLIIAD